MAYKTVFEIDGANFHTLEGFYDEVSRVLIPGAVWGRNLDAFDDILSGGFGTPEEGFVLRWRNSRASREQLGYLETMRQLNMSLRRCHPSNRTQIKEKIEDARMGRGPTVFDWLVEIILDHGPGGRYSEDGVELILE